MPVGILIKLGTSLWVTVETFNTFMFVIVKFYLAGILTLVSMIASGQTIPQNEPLKYLALGDSYTIGESVAEHQRWPVQLANALTHMGYHCRPPKIIATTGWTTDDLRQAIDAARLPKNYNLVSLLIGVNNQYQGKSVDAYAAEFEELLNTAIQCAGNQKSKVFVISIPDYGFTPFGKSKQPKISLDIDAFNTINESIAEKKGVKYINITDISRQGLKDPELVAEDGLHPSGEMYRLWVERIINVMVDK